MDYPNIRPDMPPRDVPEAVTGTLAAFFDERAGRVDDIDPEFTRVIGELRSFTLQGGKRVRPAFAWAGWLGAGGDKGLHSDAEDPAAVFRAVSALEFIQACALIHDDIIDVSATRRGFPTVHKVFEARHRDSGWRGDAAHYGHSVAILAGDIALAWADDMFHGSGVSDAARNRAREPWWKMRTEVLGGQLLDITAEASGDDRIEVAEKVNRYKTAAYTIERPLHIGARLAGAGEDVIEAYREFGRDIGIAFQLRDDQLGVFGDPAVTGKPAGDDPVLLDLGARLAQRRRDIGALQADIAEKAGVSRSTLHTIEHGGTGVRWEKVAAVAHALGLAMTFEVTGE